VAEGQRSRTACLQHRRPAEEVKQYLVAKYDYGRDDERVIPSEIYWRIPPLLADAGKEDGS